MKHTHHDPGPLFRDVPLRSAVHADDEARRIPQRELVLALMSDGSWWTFARLRDAMAARGVHASEAGISARIRDLRKAEYGSHAIDKRDTGNGLHEYRRVT